MATEEHVFERLKAAMQNRVENLLDDPDNLGDQVDALTLQHLQENPDAAQDLLTALNAVALNLDTGTVVCEYEIGNKNFCVEGLTADECAGLPGTVVNKPACDLPHWPPTN
jgi:hypothetical protein